MKQPFEKIIAYVGEVGWVGLPSAVAKSARLRLRHRSRQFYINRILKNETLARIYSFQSPTILLLSYPRSGSSWIGGVLATSPDIAYLREPINRVYYDRYAVTLADVESEDRARSIYIGAGDRAFAGIPVAGERCVRNLVPFAPWRRSDKFLLIKEVNPIAACLFADRYGPKTILLFRHPAAIADSFQRMGCLQESFAEFGYHYGLRMHNALTKLNEFQSKVIRYEDLVASPGEKFKELFSFIGATPPPHLERVINEFSLSRGSTSAHDTRRNSKNEVNKWKKNLSQESIEAVMRGYRTSGLDKQRLLY